MKNKKISLYGSAIFVSAILIVLTWQLEIDPFYPLIAGVVFWLAVGAGLLWFADQDVKQEIQYTQNKLNLQKLVTYNVTKVAELAVNDFPFGIIVYAQKEDTVSVRWVNHYIESLFGGSLLDHDIDEIHEAMSRLILEKSVSFELVMNTELGQRSLRFEHQPEQTALFITDQTAIADAKIEVLDQRQALGYISIENLDETIQSLTIQDSVNVQGRFYNAILEWAQEHDVYVRGLSTERFLLICRYQDLKAIMDKEFTVLERVRQVAKEFASELSASIGIAVSSNRSDELAETAAEALDIANKRGGDQAVVMIEGEPVKYIGGTTASVAKRSRVKSRMIANRVRQEVNQASKVLLLTHKTPDHDALGAVVGMTNLAFTLKDEVYWYIDPPVSEDVKEFYDEMLAMNKTVHGRPVKINVLTDVTDLNGFNPLTIIVDVNNKDITHGEVANVTGKKIVIDHHRQGGKEIDAEVSFVEPYASSTCEIVTEVLQYFEDEIELSEVEATLMLAGIVIDTNRFSVATGSRTFDAASYLKNNGANLQDLQKNLREDYETLIQRSRLLAQTKRMNKGFGVVLTEEYLSNKDRAKLAEMVLSINDFDASLIISKEDEGLYGMSVRSLGDVNVQLIAEALGGGGHLTSAGGIFKDTTLKKIEQQIANLLG